MLNKAVLITLTACALIGGSYLLLSRHTPSPVQAPSHEHGDDHAHDSHAQADHSEKAANTVEEHDHDKKHADENATSHDDAIRIDPAAVRDLQIEVREVAGATIRQSIAVTGRIALDQTVTAQVKARFPGIIRSVVRQPGDTVQSGDTLATVESNDSLQVYPVRSPVAGIVLSRTANVGELASDSALFVVSDLSKLWVELFVFARDGEKIRAGQSVRVRRLDEDSEAEASLTLVSPTADPSSQTIVARAALLNADGRWRPGMSVHAAIVYAETSVAMAVSSQAIQRVEGADVVFLQTGEDTYKAQPITVGISDGTWTEVRSGLEPGQRYVASNSFILKAEMGKAGAEHDH